MACGGDYCWLLVGALLWIVLLVDKAVGLSSGTSISSSHSSSCEINHHAKVQVWNNVLSPTIQSALHGTAGRIGLNHRVFTRSVVEDSSLLIPEKRNLVEEALDAILMVLQDDSKYVEYWTRQEWRSIHAHADVDEFLAKRQTQQEGRHEGEFRYPRHGHVLYLKVGTQVRGPTCVFPDRRSGRDLLAEQLSWDGISSSNEQQKVELVTVPAVPGRLLRFQGDFLHAVPRPTDLWLLKFVQGAPLTEPEEEWGRSVILFNTWGNEPPTEVPIDDCRIDSSGSDTELLDGAPKRCNQALRWNLVYPSNSRSSDGTYGVVPEEDDNHGNHVTAKIWLLGDYRRRGHQMQTVKLKATESLRQALFQEEDVRTVFLQYGPQ